MKLINVFFFFVVIKCSICKTSVITYPMVDLFENSPLNTFVTSLNLSLNVNETRKLLILNLNGFESKFFSIKNGNICTIELIDREEFVKKKYCLDQFYCKIEIHILVNDGFAYWIIPIHIIDENDNKPEFRENEIELKFRENIPNGYKIPFEGARDLDEGQNGAIDYILDCSNDLNQIKRLNESSRNCFPLFQLLILSQSSSTFDQLALRFVPSLSVNIENEYQLKLYAIDTDENENSINLNIKIEGKERAPKFSLLKYEFFILINSSLELNKSLNKIGRVYAIPNDLFQRISYKLIKTNETNDIEINSLTGELNFILNQNKTKLKDQIQFDVQASTLSSNKLLISKAKVKVSFRYLNLLNNISFQFQFDKNQNQISQLNNSNSFFINQNIQINQNLFQIFIISFYYPFDKYILSLNNYLNTFSLISSSSSLNNYFLKTHQHLTSTSIYLLNIGIKHKLSQQFLPNLTIELILIDDQSTTTTEKQILITRNEMPTIPMITSTHFKVNKLSEFCLENKSYILYNINKKKNKKNEINLLKVIKSNSILINNKMNLFISKSENKKEIIINKCRMSFNELNNSLLNKSLEYQLCSSFSTKECYNLTFEDENKVKFLVKPIEIIMFLISIIFVIITIILILLICRLKHFNICLKLKRNLFSKSNYGLNNVQQQLSSSSSKSKQRVHSIVIHESRSPSFQSIRIKNDPYVFNLDDLLQREPLPSSNMFILPPIGQSLSSYSFGQEENNDNLILTPPPRTSSSSSFLQETKQLLEMISTNQNLDLSKLVSEV